MSLKKISKRISDAVHFFEPQPQIRHFLARIGLFVQSFCNIFDVAHTKYNYNRIKVMLQLELDRIKVQ